MGQLYLNHTGGYGGKNLVNHVKKSRLLITGSEGMIGRIITNYLKDRRYNFITELDKKNPRSHVDILYDGEIKVIGVITGVCGLEEKLWIRHYKRDLVTAHRKIFDILSISNLKVELSENTIVKRYVKK